MPKIFEKNAVPENGREKALLDAIFYAEAEGDIGPTPESRILRDEFIKKGFAKSDEEIKARLTGLEIETSLKEDERIENLVQDSTVPEEEDEE